MKDDMNGHCNPQSVMYPSIRAGSRIHARQATPGTPRGPKEPLACSSSRPGERARGFRFRFRIRRRITTAAFTCARLHTPPTTKVTLAFSPERRPDGRRPGLIRWAPPTPPSHARLGRRGGNGTISAGVRVGAHVCVDASGSQRMSAMGAHGPARVSIAVRSALGVTVGVFLFLRVDVLLSGDLTTPLVCGKVRRWAAGRRAR
jgi:hypothetical protein